MLSSEGRCKTLDSAADGYVRGESVGALLLAPVPRADDQSSVLAVLKGSAVNQDGRSSALTAPNGPAQQVNAAFWCAGIDFKGLNTLQSLHSCLQNALCALRPVAVLL